ncbi:hypothetical protein J7L60_06635 [Candidatus Bathyarchaeota archaeon]|nr:hypothetical protein [Candidatus Bathyarchaeota archaeon]
MEAGRSREKMRKMANLLKSGARMLNRACPVCGTPLFQLPSGEIWCISCDKRVVIVKEGEREGAVLKPLLWEELEETLLMKLREVNMRMRVEEDPEELQRLTRLVSSLLEALEGLKRAKTD